MQALTESYLQALARQDASVENDLISSFTRAIKIKLRTHLRSPQAVEDAYQETLLRVFTYFRLGKTLRTPTSLPAFIHAVSGNVALEMVRAHRKGGCSYDDIPEPVDANPDPEGETIATERRQTVQRILCELCDKDRQLLSRICLEEEDRDEVCREFRVTRDYLRLLLYRARLRFKALIQSENGEGPSKRRRASPTVSSRLQYRTSGSRDRACDSCSRALPFRRAFAG